KNVNDTLGHDAGDRLLQAVAERLRTTLRDADTIARLGGDEFVIVLDDTGYETRAELAAQRIVEVMHQPFELADSQLPIVITTSIGVATTRRDTAGDLLRDADVALYQAKAAGKNCYATFEPDMEAAVQRRYEIELDLRRAL